jgi:hypothetical protein
MKRTHLIQQLRLVAKEAGLSLELVREGGGHEIWQVGTSRFPIPRHAEIGEQLAKKIIRQAQAGTEGQ